MAVMRSWLFRAIEWPVTTSAAEEMAARVIAAIRHG
jgi:hypothetical protein